LIESAKKERERSPIRKEIDMIEARYSTPSKNNNFITSSPNRYSSPSRSNNKITSSPMKGNEETHLALAMKESIDNDRSLEESKNQLAIKADFNLLDAFRYFDVKGKGYINRIDLESGLKRFGIYATNNEMYLFMRKYDSDNDSLLKYTDFCEAITPKAVEYASILT